MTSLELSDSKRKGKAPLTERDLAGDEHPGLLFHRSLHYRWSLLRKDSDPDELVGRGVMYCSASQSQSQSLIG